MTKLIFPRPSSNSSTWLHSLRLRTALVLRPQLDFVMRCTVQICSSYMCFYPDVSLDSEQPYKLDYIDAVNLWYGLQFWCCSSPVTSSHGLCGAAFVTLHTKIIMTPFCSGKCGRHKCHKEQAKPLGSSGIASLRSL